MMVSLIRVLALVAVASGSVAIVGGVIRYAWLILAVVAAVALLWLLWFAVWLDRRLTTRDATRAARVQGAAGIRSPLLWRVQQGCRNRGFLGTGVAPR